MTETCPVHSAFDPLGDAFDPAQEIPFHPNISFRGPQALWVEA